MRKVLRYVGFGLIGIAIVLFSVDIYASYQNETTTQELNEFNEQLTRFDDSVFDDLLPDETVEPNSGKQSIWYFNKINQAFFEINKDYIGWIEIDELSISYPMVKGKDNDYYLRHSFNRKSSRHGAIFMDYRNQIDFSDQHIVIYGHAMRDGTMFRPFDRIKNSKGFVEGMEIAIRTLDSVDTYRIFSVYLVDARTTSLDIPANDKDVLKMAMDFKKKSRYKIDEDISNITQILTLVSCNYDIDHGRIIIHAIKVND